jgi:hypothetical protein
MIEDNAADAPKGQTVGSNGAPTTPDQQTAGCNGAKMISNGLSAVMVTEDGRTIDGSCLAMMLGVDQAVVQEALRNALAQPSKENASGANDGPPDAAIPPSAPPSEDDPFDETMRRLVFPANLRDYYAEIYVGFRKCISNIVIPANTHLIQRALEKVSANVDEGMVDGRGPVGLLIYMLKQWAAVPGLSERLAKGC